MVQLQEDEDVVGQPADEEGDDEGRHDLQRLGGPLDGTAHQPAGDHRVAHDDNDERDNEATDKATNGDGDVAMRVCCVAVEAVGSAHMSLHVSEYDGGDAQNHREDPRHSDRDGRGSGGPVVLSPHGEHHSDAPVHTDEDQQEDAAEHIHEHHEGGELAQEGAKDPVLHGHKGYVKRVNRTDQEIRHSQAEVPGGVDCLLHLETSDPNHYSISKDTQKENDSVDHHKGDAGGVCETC